MPDARGFQNVRVVDGREFLLGGPSIFSVSIMPA